MVVAPAARQVSPAFDHDYLTYAALLSAYVHGPRVDYAALHRNRAQLDRVTGGFAIPGRAEESAWTRPQRMAFWINAYNALTLRAIVDHYPIEAGWFSLGPRNSIRQIEGVWTTLTWDAAGRRVSLDDIEHRILRPEFGDARIHFAINCASVSCPPLAAAPYGASGLDAQLDEAARAYLASPQGLRFEPGRLRVSSIFKWYGDDFIGRYAATVPGDRPRRDRAILGTIAEYGPPAASAAARAGTPAIRYLEYDWSLNDTTQR
jgi:hypothetical protein